MVYFNKKTAFLLYQIILIICFTSCNTTDKKEQGEKVDKQDSYLTDELSIQHGMQLFNAHCASCHNFNENVIGPSLGGVTSKASKEWLLNFIQNPKKSIESGDERAGELYAKYKVYMPSFETIKGQDLEHLLGFIHRFSEAEQRSIKKRSGAITNPIPEKISQSNFTLVIEELLTVPPSSETIPKARINKLSGVQTEQGERLFIADLRGKLYEVVDSTTQVYLDLKLEINEFIDNPGWGTGLGSFDFHPEFDKNGLFYTTHTEPANSSKADFAIPDSIPVKLQWVLTEWKADDPFTQEFSGKKREVLRVDMVTAAHGFQELTFNPLAKKGDAEYGLLYLGIGDGASALRGYPFLCDNPGKIWGSVIRIDPIGSDSRNENYGIPKDNPFVKEPNKLDEIWSSGFRNPHRISWDQSGSGNMLVSNIGQHSVEEIDLIKKGANYGWPNREGTFTFDVNANTEVVYSLPEEDSDYTYPVIQFDHDEGNAVSGGFVYVGSKISLLRGKYVFGDIPRGILFYSETSDIIEGQQAPVYKFGLELNGKLTSLAEISDNQRVNLRFGKDSSGELFIFTKSNGTVYKVVGCKTPSTLQ